MSDNFEVKEILIKDLPDSYEKEQLSSFCTDPQTSHVHVIAKEGFIGDWACYIGWPNLEHLKKELMADLNRVWYAENQHEPSGVLAHGDKISKEMACAIFPEWKDKSYRS